MRSRESLEEEIVSLRAERNKLSQQNNYYYNLLSALPNTMRDMQMDVNTVTRLALETLVLKIQAVTDKVRVVAEG